MAGHLKERPMLSDPAVQATDTYVSKLERAPA